MTLIGFKVANEQIEWSHLRSLWTLVDEIDQYDVGWDFDHFYPVYCEVSEPCLEGWTTLAALAEATSRIRLGCLVGAVPYRHPAVTANMAATIDVISDGRLELGLGCGWHTSEADAYGLTLPEVLGERFDLFDEACEVIISLLSTEQTNVSGEYFEVKDAFMEPKGPQSPPPITIGGTGPKRTLRAVARFADWWNTPFWDPAAYPALVETLEAHCADLDRDPGEIRHSTHVMISEGASASEIEHQVGSVIEAGIDQPILYFQPPPSQALIIRAGEAIATLGIDHT